MDGGADRLRLHRARRRSRRRMEAQFAKAVSPGFDFARDLERVGLANQTTMLSGESLAIAEEVRRSIERRYGADGRAGSLPLVRHHLLGDAGAAGRGARPARGAARRHGGGRRVQLEQHLPPRGAGAIAGHAHLPHRGRRRRGSRRGHHPSSADRNQARRSTAAGWLGDARTIGITAGASTPNNKVGETIARICELAGVAEELRAQTA